MCVVTTTSTFFCHCLCPWGTRTGPRVCLGSYSYLTRTVPQSYSHTTEVHAHSHHWICYFLVAVIEYPDKNNLWEKGFSWAKRSRGTASITMWRAWQWASVVGRPLTTFSSLHTGIREKERGEWETESLRNELCVCLTATGWNQKENTGKRSGLL